MQDMARQKSHPNEDRDSLPDSMEEATSSLESPEDSDHGTKLKDLGTMAAGLAHEINNPLNYAILGVELLKREGRDMMAPDYDSIIRDVQDGLIRIKNIVQDLKTYSHKAQDGAVRNQSFLAGDAIASAIRLTSQNFHGVEVTTTLDTPYKVYGDASSIVQVLINLLSNALDSVTKKWPEVGGKIEIFGRIEHGRYLVEMVDNGQGMTLEQINRIFEPFYTTKGPKRGTGLGLSICRSIIRRHGGDILVESTPGEWTSFRFDLEIEN